MLFYCIRFSVPHDSPDWPENVWNMKLGGYVTVKERDREGERERERDSDRERV